MTHYCIICGTKLATEIIEDRDREVCLSCGWINYESLKVSAGVRIEKDGRLLLVQRGHDPWKGKWYLPAGFVEIDEEPFQGAIREAYEETGLRVKIKNLADVYTYTDDPRGNGIVVLFDAEIVEGELRLTNETIDAGFYSAGEISNMQFAGATVVKQVDDWLRLNGYKKEQQA
jgi:8-oxo-dGTP diphosphatase